MLRMLCHHMHLVAKNVFADFTCFAFILCSTFPVKGTSEEIPFKTPIWNNEKNVKYVTTLKYDPKLEKVILSTRTILFFFFAEKMVIDHTKRVELSWLTLPLSASSWVASDLNSCTGVTVETVQGGGQGCQARQGHHNQNHFPWIHHCDGHSVMILFLRAAEVSR